MADTQREEILSKIQKLLRKADKDKNPSIAEVETALAMAHKLLKKYHLSMSEVLALNAEDGTVSSSIDLTEELGACFKASTVPKWMSLLISAVNQLTQTRTLIRYGKPDPGKSYGDLKIAFVGDETDVSISIELFNFLRNCVQRMSTTHTKEVNGKFQQWRSFAEGCSTKLLQRSLKLEDEKNWDLKKYQQSSTASNIDLDDRIMDDDDDFEDLPDDEDEDSEEESDDNPSENQKQKYEIYLVTKQQKIEDYFSNPEIKREEVTNSLKLDKESFEQGKVAADDLPLKLNKQLNPRKQKGVRK